MNTETISHLGQQDISPVSELKSAISSHLTEAKTIFAQIKQNHNEKGIVPGQLVKIDKAITNLENELGEESGNRLDKILSALSNYTYEANSLNIITSEKNKPENSVIQKEELETINFSIKSLKQKLIDSVKKKMTDTKIKADIRAFLKAAGHNPNEPGMCFGITYMAIKAAIRGEFTSFMARLEKINQSLKIPEIQELISDTTILSKNDAFCSILKKNGFTENEII